MHDFMHDKGLQPGDKASPSDFVDWFSNSQRRSAAPGAAPTPAQPRRPTTPPNPPLRRRPAAPRPGGRAIPPVRIPGRRPSTSSSSDSDSSSESEEDLRIRLIGGYAVGDRVRLRTPLRGSKSRGLPGDHAVVLSRSTNGNPDQIQVVLDRRAFDGSEARWNVFPSQLRRATFVASAIRLDRKRSPFPKKRVSWSPTVLEIASPDPATERTRTLEVLEQRIDSLRPDDSATPSAHRRRVRKLVNEIHTLEQEIRVEQGLPKRPGTPRWREFLSSRRPNARPPAPPPVNLKIGDLVQIAGLVKAKQFNGQRATVSGPYDRAKGRYNVTLASGKQISVRVQSLTRVYSDSDRAYFDTVPDECVMMMFRYLPCRELGVMRTVCRKFKRLASRVETLTTFDLTLQKAFQPINKGAYTDPLHVDELPDFLERFGIRWVLNEYYKWKERKEVKFLPARVRKRFENRANNETFHVCQSMLDVINRFHQLRSIRLSWKVPRRNDVGPGDALPEWLYSDKQWNGWLRTFLSVVERMPKIESIHLNSFVHSRDKYRMLTDFLRREEVRQRIRKIGVSSYIEVDDFRGRMEEGICDAVPEIKRFLAAVYDSAVEELDLSGTVLDTKLLGMDPIAEDPKTIPNGRPELQMLVAPGSKLRSLSLSCCNLDDTFIEELCGWIRGNTTLEELRLDDNYFTSKGVKAIARMLTKNKSLRSVGLGGTDWRAVGQQVKDLADALKVNTHVKTLYFQPKAAADLYENARNRNGWVGMVRDHRVLRFPFGIDVFEEECKEMYQPEYNVTMAARSTRPTAV